jgi:hypothetical protein
VCGVAYFWWHILFMGVGMRENRPSQLHALLAFKDMGLYNLLLWWFYVLSCQMKRDFIFKHVANIIGCNQGPLVYYNLYRHCSSEHYRRCSAQQHVSSLLIWCVVSLFLVRWF